MADWKQSGQNFCHFFGQNLECAVDEKEYFENLFAEKSLCFSSIGIFLLHFPCQTVGNHSAAAADIEQGSHTAHWRDSRQQNRVCGDFQGAIFVIKGEVLEVEHAKSIVFKKMLYNSP